MAEESSEGIVQTQDKDFSSVVSLLTQMDKGVITRDQTKDRLLQLPMEVFLGRAEEYYNGGLLEKILFDRLDDYEKNNNPKSLAWAFSGLITYCHNQYLAGIKSLPKTGEVSNHQAEKIAVLKKYKADTAQGVTNSASAQLQQYFGQYILGHSAEEVGQLSQQIYDDLTFFGEIFKTDPDSLSQELDRVVRGSVAAVRSEVFMERVLGGCFQYSDVFLDVNHAIDFWGEQGVIQVKSMQTHGYPDADMVRLTVNPQTLTTTEIPLIRFIEDSFKSCSPLVGKEGGNELGSKRIYLKKGTEDKNFDIKGKHEFQFTCLRFMPFLSEDGKLVSFSMETLQFNPLNKENPFDFVPVKNFQFGQVFGEALALLSSRELDLLFDSGVEDPEMINEAFFAGSKSSEIKRSVTLRPEAGLKKYSEQVRQWLKFVLLATQAHSLGYLGETIKPMYFVTTSYWDLEQLVAGTDTSKSLAQEASDMTGLIHKMKEQLAVSLLQGKQPSMPVAA
jgi:hypothetical protein